MACARIFQVIECWIFLSNRDQIYLLKVVAFLWRSFLKLDLWALNLVLKGPAVRPTYVSSLWLSCLLTVVWYITDDVRQFPLSGHGWFLQLQLVVVCVAESGLFVVLSSDLFFCRYDLLYVGFTTVANFDSVSVEDLSELVLWGETLV